jgi:F420H(2)-dependent quinone reductase
MKIIKVAVILLVVYAAIVAAFESMIGYIQPTQETTVVITTFDAAGAPHDRVVSRLESAGQVYVAANHWPRAWYERALANPKVQVAMDGQKTDHQAVPVTGDEHERVDADNRLPLLFRFVTGFPPRYFLRLDPPASGNPA